MKFIYKDIRCRKWKVIPYKLYRILRWFRIPVSPHGKWISKTVFKYKGASIKDADTAFEKKFRVNPTKAFHFSCEVIS